MTALAISVLLLWFVVLIEIRMRRNLEKRVEQLEEVAHPPVDVRTVVKAYTRKEVERVLAEQVP